MRVVRGDLLGQFSLFLFVVASAFAQGQQSAPTKSITPQYAVVHTLALDREEFISVVVKPGIPDSELMALAIELHKLHPRSNISFYDKMDTARIKQRWNCFADAIHRIDNPRCPDEPDPWINAHQIGSVSSAFDSPNRTGQPKWFLEGKRFRRIGLIPLTRHGPFRAPDLAPPEYQKFTPFPPWSGFCHPGGSGAWRRP